MIRTSRMVRVVMAGLVISAGTMLPSCIASNLLDSNQRMLQPTPVEREWNPPSPTDVEGQFESVQITGEVAGSVLKIYYYFAPDGRFSGAALVVGASGPTFQVLEGRWTLSDGKLSLGPDSEPADLHKSGDALRLTTTDGCVVLKRVTV